MWSWKGAKSFKKIFQRAGKSLCERTTGNTSDTKRQWVSLHLSCGIYCHSSTQLHYCTCILGWSLPTAWSRKVDNLEVNKSGENKQLEALGSLIFWELWGKLSLLPLPPNLPVLCSGLEWMRRKKNYRFLLVALRNIWDFNFFHKEIICTSFAAWRTNYLSGRNLPGQPERSEALQIHSRLSKILDGDGLLYVMQKMILYFL